MDHMERNRRKDRIIDGVAFAALLFAASAVCLRLFHMQTLGGVDSDMKAYILEMQGLDSGYSFPYPIFFKLAGLVHLFAPPELSVAIALVFMNGLGMVVTKLALHRLAMDSGSSRGVPWHKGVICSLLAVSLFFISMLYPPKGIYLPGIRFRYLGVFTANPFHNATYMAARPFAILAFLWFGKLLREYEKGIGKKGKDYLLFALFLLAATMTKPSFTLVLVSSAGLLMLYRLFRSGFRNFVPTIQLGVCFIPTFLALLYQYAGVFVPEEGEEGGLGFCLGSVWMEYCDNIPLGICLAMGFPLLVLLLNWKKVKGDTLTRFSWMLYLVSLAEAFLLYEKGFRRVDFNFSWGYMYGIFFCHFSSLLLLTRLTADRWGKTGEAETDREELEAAEERQAGKQRNAEGERQAGKQRNAGGERQAGKQRNAGGERQAGKQRNAGGERQAGKVRNVGKARKAAGWLLLVQWLAYLGHVACGILYFRDLLAGGTYY